MSAAHSPALSAHARRRAASCGRTSPPWPPPSARCLPSRRRRRVPPGARSTRSCLRAPLHSLGRRHRGDKTQAAVAGWHAGTLARTAGELSEVGGGGLAGGEAGGARLAVDPQEGGDPTALRARAEQEVLAAGAATAGQVSHARTRTVVSQARHSRAAAAYYALGQPLSPQRVAAFGVSDHPEVPRPPPQRSAHLGTHGGGGRAGTTGGAAAVDRRAFSTGSR
eukprot:COSAG01_NODE_1941_length_8843_cov_33.836802_11_plen_223_part_00